MYGNKAIISLALSLLGFSALSPSDNLHPVPAMRTTLPILMRSRFAMGRMSEIRSRVTLNSADNLEFELPSNFLLVNQLLTKDGELIDQHEVIGKKIHTKSSFETPILDYYGYVDFLAFSAFDEAFAYSLAASIRPTLDDSSLSSAQYYDNKAELLFRTISNAATANTRKPFSTEKFKILNAR